MEQNAEMRGQTRLQKRGSTYYFRAMVPKDLYAHYGRKEIIFSLRTKEYREAKRLVRLQSVRLDNEFEAIRNQRPPGKTRTISVLDEATIKGLCDTWRHTCLSTDVWSRAQGLSDAEYEDARAQRAETLDALREVLAKGRLDRIAPALHQFLSFINVDFVGPPEDLRRLTWSFLEAAIETHQGIMRRDQGDVVPVPAAPTPVIGKVSTTVTEDTSSSPRFVDCFAIWEVAVINRPTKTIADFRSVMDDFVLWAGDRAVTQYTSEDVYAFADHVRLRDNLDPATVDKKITYLRAIYNAAKKRLKLAENPFSNIHVPRARSKRPKRLPYDHNDLKHIFSAPVFREKVKPRGGAGEAAVWLPLLSLFSGARLEELGQLLVTDIGSERGIHFLDITDLPEEDGLEIKGQALPEKRLKNEQSRRRVPIHPELIRLGFLRYVDSLKKQREKRLFPRLKPDCHGKITGNFSKWWGNYRRKVIGIQGRLKPFHSFRHSFRDACREAELGEEIADAFMGHAKGDRTGRSYGGGFSLAALHRAICKIHYPGLKITVLDEQNPDR